MRLHVGPYMVDMLDADDRIAARELKGEAFEPATRHAWINGLRPDRLALDVGAYTGLYAIAAAVAGIPAIAIEPHPANLARLGQNVRRNPRAVGKVRMISGAASDRDGTAVFKFNDKVRLTSGGSLEENPNRRIEYRQLEVQTHRIDSLRLPPLGVIKIDVERHEPAVLRGAAETIKRDRPAIIAEALDEGSLEAMLAELPGYGLSVRLDGSNVLLMPGPGA